MTPVPPLNYYEMMSGGVLQSKESVLELNDIVQQGKERARQIVSSRRQVAVRPTRNVPSRSACCSRAPTDHKARSDGTAKKAPLDFLYAKAHWRGTGRRRAGSQRIPHNE